jgi:ribosome modulation factor
MTRRPLLLMPAPTTVRMDVVLPVLVRGLTEKHQTKAFMGAWLKGFHAAIAGKKKDVNPYGDDRTDRGGVTYARAFWREWGRGHEAGVDHLGGS